MKYILTVIIALAILNAQGQQVEHIQRLELNRKDKEVFNKGDSSMVLRIDTLIMKDRAKLEFFAKKDVKLVVGYAEIGENVIIIGQDSKNNATNFDIDINFQELESLHIIARGIDAFNGTKTHPNGDGGEVNLRYNPRGITPQREDKKSKHYIFVDVKPGGLRVNPSSEINQIYGRISLSSPGLRGLPQGQIYSGSPGKEGQVTIEPKD
ncbi:MAG: hypothetical protein ACTHZ1_04435 [Sphingobacterium sp.]